MQTPDPIEAALARLMPTAMSVSGQRSIEDMLDALAADLPAAKVVPWYRRPAIGLSAAAAIAGLLAIPALLHTGSPAAVPRYAGIQAASVDEATAGATPTLQLVTESDRIQSVADEGWIANPDGSVRQAVRVRSIGENTFKDRETGYTVRISEPREETVLMPVSSF